MAFHKQIIAASNCPPERVQEVEDMMRVKPGTLLGELNAREFRKLAKDSWAAVQYIDEHPDFMKEPT